MEKKIERCKLKSGTFKIRDPLTLDQLKDEKIAWDSEWCVPVRIIKYSDEKNIKWVVLDKPMTKDKDHIEEKYLINNYDDQDGGSNDLRFRKMILYERHSYSYDELDVFGQLQALNDYAASCLDLVDQIEELDLSALILDLTRLKHDIRYDGFGNRIEP